jgi:hypothetical protein
LKARVDKVETGAIAVVEKRDGGSLDLKHTGKEEEKYFGEILKTPILNPCKHINSNFYCDYKDSTCP